MLSDSERLYILIVQYGLARDAEYENKIMLLCARIRGQGMRVCLGWCARAFSFGLLLAYSAQA